MYANFLARISTFLCFVSLSAYGNLDRRLQSTDMCRCQRRRDRLSSDDFSSSSPVINGVRILPKSDDACARRLHSRFLSENDYSLGNEPRRLKSSSDRKGRKQKMGSSLSGINRSSSQDSDYYVERAGSMGKRTRSRTARNRASRVFPCPAQPPAENSSQTPSPVAIPPNPTASPINPPTSFPVEQIATPVPSTVQIRSGTTSPSPVEVTVRCGDNTAATLVDIRLVGVRTCGFVQDNMVETGGMVCMSTLTLGGRVADVCQRECTPGCDPLPEPRDPPKTVPTMSPVEPIMENPTVECGNNSPNDIVNVALIGEMSCAAVGSSYTPLHAGLCAFPVEGTGGSQLVSEICQRECTEGCNTPTPTPTPTPTSIPEPTPEPTGSPTATPTVEIAGRTDDELPTAAPVFIFQTIPPDAFFP